MADRLPVVCLGAGSAGEAFVAAMRRHDPEVRIVVVERALVGGECTYFACMPSKTLLRAPEILAQARRAPGAGNGRPDAAEVFAWRDAVVDGRQDSGHLPWLEERRVELVRGEARVREPGVLEVGGEELRYGALVVATGSSPAIPPIPGLDGAGVWTTRDATAAGEVPERLVVVGGGAAGCELAQAYRGLGSEVTLVQSGPRLLPQLHERGGEALAEAFREEGIELRLGARVEAVSAVGVSLRGGETLPATQVLIATGRTPNVEGLGLERLGVKSDARGIEVDERLRAAEGVWGIGDATGVALLTHVGKYQARVAAADIAGHEARADYRAIPAVVFTDPQVATVGTTEGDGLVHSERAMQRTSRTSTFERPKRPGFVRVTADPARRVLVGAVAVGPEAGEWLGQLTLAIRAEVPVDVVADTIQPFPTFSEAIHFAVRELPV